MLDRAKKRLNSLKEDIKGIKYGTTKLSKGDRAFYTSFTAISGVALSAVPACAESVFDQLQEVVTKYYGQISTIAIGLGALLAVVALIIWLFVPSDRGAEMGKRWFIRILVCVAILCCLGGIFSLIGEITEGQGLDINEVTG